jgi:hypothetical protein
LRLRISTACTSFFARVRWRTKCTRRARRRRNARVGSSGNQQPCNNPAASSRASVRASRQSVLTSELYGKRQPMIEPVFANTKFNRKMTRFHRRGRAAARTEWRLITATHNLRG